MQYLETVSSIMSLGLYVLIARKKNLNIFGELKNTFVNKTLVLIFSIVVAIAIIKYLDMPIRDYFQHIYNQKLFHQLELVSWIAKGDIIFFILSVVYIIIYLIKKKLKKCEFFKQVLEISFVSSIYADIAVSILKVMFLRHRPLDAISQWDFFNLNDVANLFSTYSSMPSGHTASIIAALLPFYIFYRHYIVRYCISYIVLLVAFARIYTMNHWLSDTFASVVLSFIIVFAVCKKYLHSQ